MFKVNQSTSQVIENLKKVLLTDEILFNFEVVQKANTTALVIEKETQKAEYNVYGMNQLDKMEKFLTELKGSLPTFLHDDIECLIDEIQYS